MRRLLSTLVVGSFLFGMASTVLAAGESLVLRDFEGKFEKSGDLALKAVGADTTYVGGYCGPNSTSVVSILESKGCTGAQALKIEWDKSDWAGIGIDFTPGIFSSDYKAFRISYKGEGTGYKWRIQLKDNGNEQHCVVMEDDSTTWKTVTIPISDFAVREDWQPENKDGNGVIDFPILNVNLESYDNGPVELWIDEIEAVK